jgi:hypothetical protein
MNNDPVSWLTQEVRDLLDVSPVGLYLDEAHLHSYAEAALDNLLH